MAQRSAQLGYLEHLRFMARRSAPPVDLETSSATEHSPLRRKLDVKKLLQSSSGNSVGLQSSSGDSVGEMPLRLDDAAMNDEFWIENISEFTAEEYSAAVKRHSRRPDLTMSIRIYMRTGSASAWQVSSGVYLGHGQSKTTFLLISQASQTNGILK